MTALPASGIGALHADLLSVATRLVGPADAEDLVQDTWVAAQRSIEGWSPEGGAFGAWMLVILRRQAVNLHRRTRRRPSVVDAQSSPDPADEVVGADRWRECLALLTPRERAAVELVYQEGLSHAEAAAKLGISPHAVATRSSRAVLRLKKCLAA